MGRHAKQLAALVLVFVAFAAALAQAQITVDMDLIPIGSTMFDLGCVDISMDHRDFEFTVRNPGSVPLTINIASPGYALVEPVGHNHFSYPTGIGNDIEGPIAANGGSDNFKIRFTPPSTAETACTVTVRISYGSPATIFEFYLTVAAPSGPESYLVLRHKDGDIIAAGGSDPASYAPCVPREYTIENFGSASFNASVSVDAPFSSSLTTSTGVALYDSLDFTITLAATETASSPSSQVSVANNATNTGGNARAFSVSGSSRPAISVRRTPSGDVVDGGSTVPFGEVKIPQPSGSDRSMTFVIDKSTDCGLTLTGSPKVAVTGDSALSATHQPTAGIILPSTTQVERDFTVQFAVPSVFPDPAPSDPSYEATVSIPYTDPAAQEYTFTVSGSYTWPVLTIKDDASPTPNTISCGDEFAFQTTGAYPTPAPAHTFTITNDGTADLVLSRAPALTNTPGSPFSLQYPSGDLNIPKGQSRAFTITFTPTTDGRYEDTVTIASDDPTKTGDCTFTVVGVCPESIGIPMLYVPPGYPPTIDGKVRDDPGWTGTARITYGNGVTTIPVALQALRDLGNQNLYFSFEVANDITFDGNDIVVIALRPTRSSNTLDEIRFVLKPVQTGMPSNQTRDPVEKQFFWRRVSWSTATAWPVDPNLQVKVTAVEADGLWNVEMSLPTNLQVTPTQSIGIADEFLLYLNVIRDFGSTAQEYIWPRTAQVVSGAFETYPFGAEEWGFADKSDGALGNGVWISEGDIGSANQPDSEISLYRPNVLHGVAHNDSRVGDQQPTARQVYARFFVSNWGMPAPDQWTQVPDASTTAPRYDIPGGQSHSFEVAWTLSQDEQEFYSQHRSQCIMVELDADPVNDGSAPDAVFARSSASRNMDFVTTSQFSRVATIGTRGYGPPPEGRTAHEFILQVTARETKPGSDDPTAAGFAPDGRSSRLAWICEGFRATGNYIEISGTRYDLYDPVGAFGYVASHDGPVARWEWAFRGAEKIGPNRYRLTIPPGEEARVRTRIAPVEYTRSWSAHVGTAIPLCDLATGATTGICALVDRGFPLTSWLAFEAVAGYYGFPLRTPGGQIASWFSASANLKAYLELVSVVSGYANVGLGGYLPLGGSPQFGGNVGAGLSVRISNLMSAETGLDYHVVAGSWTQFLTLHAGVVFRF